MALMKMGSENRKVAETLMNEKSSRSHSVFSIIIESSSKTESGVTSTRFSRLNFVDLAGRSGFWGQNPEQWKPYPF